MVVLTYKDEDGEQTTTFDNMDECNEFIAHNETRCLSFFDEEFEIISIDQNE